MPTPDEPEEIRTNLENLARRGKHINRVQRWILITCYENYHSVKELADLQNVSYQGMYVNVKRLVDLNLLDKAYSEGREWFYKCRFDLSETADYTYRFRIKKQNLTFEELLMYYFSNELKFYPRQVFLTLIYLYKRSLNKAEGKPIGSVTGTEAKTFVLRMCEQIEEFATNMRILTEGKLFEQTENCHEMYGPVEGPVMEDLMSRFETDFANFWAHKLFSTKGLQVSSPKELMEEARQEYIKDKRVGPREWWAEDSQG